MSLSVLDVERGCETWLAREVVSGLKWGAWCYLQHDEMDLSDRSSLWVKSIDFPVLSSSCSELWGASLTKSCFWTSTNCSLIFSYGVALSDGVGASIVEGK